MIQKDESSIILLTYKGKILLMLFENDPTILENPLLFRKSVWKFLGGAKRGYESFEEAVINRVEGLTRIKLSSVDLVSRILEGKSKKYVYHASLSDKDVNRMERINGLLLQFYSFKELEKLSLSYSTKLVIEKHRDFFEGIQRSSVVI